MDNQQVISVLNGLIETCKDGEQGFKTAAEGLADPQIKSLFQQFSRQRGEMARELQGEVRRLGGDPDKSGSIAGARAPRLDQHQVGRHGQRRWQHRRGS